MSRINQLHQFEEVYIPWPRNLARISELSDDPEKHRHHSEEVTDEIIVL